MLLDVNVLLALGWAEHEAHPAVVARLTGRPGPNWYTCPITELGFIRISSTSGIFSRTLAPAQAQAVLAGLCRDGRHGFLADHPSVRDCDLARLTGPRQTTDAYLLALAAHHRHTLLTLDERMRNAFGDEGIELVVAA